MSSYADFYRRSLQDRDRFWAEQAQLIEWRQQPRTICDYSRPPFTNWFAGGTTNLCHNAVDRHLKDRPDQAALIYVSTETGEERTYSFRELHGEVQRAAAALMALGVKKGDRVLIYMPMVAQAAFAMLACARIGAIHSVVFGGFASVSLASRIEDATPKVIVSADAGSRGGKVVAYKPLLDEAIRLSRHKPESVLLVDRGLAPMEKTAGRDHDWAALTQRHADAKVDCEWLDATDVSYTIYTSGTTGSPKGVQRDVGGYAVALAASMKHIFLGEPGETYFSTSDIGWVVGHSYIIYGPLLAGMATIMYEGLPIRPDAGIWWSLVEKYKVSAMFSAPTAVRVLKKQDPAFLKKYDLSSLKALFLAGEPLDEPTARWISDGLGVPIIDNYWQTESGWPILALANGVERQSSKFGSPGLPMYGFDVKLVHENTGEELTRPNEKGVVVIEGPTPPGFMQTVWGDDARYVKTYWETVPGRMVYSTFDWGIRDKDGYFFILGPHRRRDQRGRPPARHARDRGEHFQPPQRGRGGRRGRGGSVEGPGRHGVRGGEGCQRPGRRPGQAQARGRDHESGRRAARGRRPSRPGPVRQHPAQDPQRQAAAPRDPGGVRRAQPGRPDHHRGSGGTAADPRPAGLSGARRPACGRSRGSRRPAGSSRSAGA